MNGKEMKVEVKAKKANIIEIDGELYAMEKETEKKIDGVVHSDKLVFKKFDKKEYTTNLKVVIDELSKKVTKKELLNELLDGMDMKTLRRLVKRIKTKKPIKKQKGCLGFKIGDTYVQLMA